MDEGRGGYTEARRQRCASALKTLDRTRRYTIRFLTPDVALAHVTHAIRGMLDESGREQPPHRELSSRCETAQRAPGGAWETQPAAQGGLYVFTARHYSYFYCAVRSRGPASPIRTSRLPKRPPPTTVS